MLINADFKGLEWLAAVYLSGDATGYKEILGGVDQHGENQRSLNLPSRLIAKTFVFRLIYGGSAFAYAHYAEFAGVSTSEKYWQGIIDAFYEKYRGLKQWHDQLMETAMSEGKITIPTGRTFRFQREFQRGTREGKWPRTKILNYPVQGFGADLMMLTRNILSSKLNSLGLQVGTVHDSIVIDAPSANVSMIVKKIFQTWEELPLRFEKEFGQVFDLQCKVEVKIGHNLKEMEEVHADSND